MTTGDACEDCTFLSCNDATLVATSQIALHALKFIVILFTEIELATVLLLCLKGGMAPYKQIHQQS